MLAEECYICSPVSHASYHLTCKDERVQPACQDVESQPCHFSHAMLRRVNTGWNTTTDCFSNFSAVFPALPLLISLHRVVLSHLNRYIFGEETRVECIYSNMQRVAWFWNEQGFPFRVQCFGFQTYFQTTVFIICQKKWHAMDYTYIWKVLLLNDLCFTFFK